LYLTINRAIKPGTFIEEKMAKKILIIDDEHDLAEILQIRLVSEGYEVECAHDGITGLELAKSISPQLIILDIMMPHLNGFAVCSLLKGNEQYRHIPIIILTARDEKNDRLFSEDVKPEAFINKPFATATLLSKVRELAGEP
jgi:DNA-binding response OmpR family regulator